MSSPSFRPRSSIDSDCSTLIDEEDIAHVYRTTLALQAAAAHENLRSPSPSQDRYATEPRSWTDPLASTPTPTSTSTTVRERIGTASRIWRKMKSKFASTRHAASRKRQSSVSLEASRPDATPPAPTRAQPETTPLPESSSSSSSSPASRRRSVRHSWMSMSSAASDPDYLRYQQYVTRASLDDFSNARSASRASMLAMTETRVITGFFVI